MVTHEGLAISYISLIKSAASVPDLLVTRSSPPFRLEAPRSRSEARPGREECNREREIGRMGRLVKSSPRIE